MSALVSASKTFVACRRTDQPSPCGLLNSTLKIGIVLTSIIVISIAVLTIEASARGGGGGGGGGGISMGGRGGGGAGLGRIGGGGGFAPRSFSGPRLGGSGMAGRSLGGNRSVTRSLAPSTTRSATMRAVPGGAGNRFVTASTHSVAVPGTLSRNVTRAHAVLGNRFITNAALRSAIAPVRFHGRFHGSPWPWWRGGIVIGWVGPVFWPYVYYDFFDYVFWPYVYDDFWPYAYDDVYYGIYGAYAYGDQGLSDAPRRTVHAAGAKQRPAGICGGRSSDLTDWPIERIAETVQPTDGQRAGLDALKQASAKTVDLLKDACPKELPSIPTGRLAAMQSRLEVMLAAVKTVRPALDGFYQSLSDEQKARFNAVAPSDEAAAGKDQRDFTKFCDVRSPGVTDLPIDRIARAVQPSEPQRAALDELSNASLKAADALKANCPTYRALTPVGRVEAMEQRLDATLGAVKTVQPALVKFYDMLTDEQKARFNALRSGGARA